MWIALACLLIDVGTVSADCSGFSAVVLSWRHESDSTVPLPIVVQADERCHPGAGLFTAREWSAGVVRPVFHLAEQGFGVGVVVADPWPAEGSEHTQFLWPDLQRRGAYGIAAVGIEDQRPPVSGKLSP